MTSTSKTGPDPAKSRGSRRGPIIRFVASFSALLALFQVLIFYVITPSEAFQTYLHLSAHASALLLELVGHSVTVDGSSITAMDHSMSVEIRRGCDGLAPVSIMAAGVLAVSGALGRKVCGVLIGVGVLLAANLVRIASMYLIGVHSPEHFDQSHQFVWPLALIALAVLYWIFWADRVSTRTPTES